MNQTPLVDDGVSPIHPDLTDDKGEDRTVGGFSLPSLSTRNLLLLVAILTIALLVWRANQARSSPDDSREIVEDDSIEGIHIPENPDDPLRADSAVIAGLKEAGVMG